MNGRTARFLRLVAAIQNAHYRTLKRGWKKMNHIERGKFRREHS